MSKPHTKAGHGSVNICVDNNGCIICRGEVTQSIVDYKPAMYPGCSLVVQGESADPDDDSICLPMEPLTRSDQIACGVVECEVDLSNETDPCPQAMLNKNIVVDPNMINWPEDFTEDDIKCVVMNAKCCLTFAELNNCTPVPDCYADQLLEAKLAKQ